MNKLLLTGFYCAITVLYFAPAAQAQIHTLDITSENEIIQSTEQKQQPKFYVEPKSNDKVPKKQGLPKVEDENSIPPDLAVPNETDEAAQQQIDRVFETYKALALKQKEAADAMPMKKEQTKQAADNLQKAPSTGISGILDQYQASKAKPTHTQTLTITDPDHYSSPEKTAKQ